MASRSRLTSSDQHPIPGTGTVTAATLKCDDDETWGEDVPSEGMSEMDHGDMSSDNMAGMMDQEDMAALESASGAQFDRMFLTMMSEHHQGAIQMARTEQANGENPDALALAKRIEADQEAEIQTMRELLERF